MKPPSNAGAGWKNGNQRRKEKAVRGRGQLSAGVKEGKSQTSKGSWCRGGYKLGGRTMGLRVSMSLPELWELE